jgi:predicted TIM-barrel fold metal-dependent hydrolase
MSAATAAVQTVVDCGVHPIVRDDDELRAFMPTPWRKKLFPGPQRYHYAHPESEYLAGSRPGGGRPGSDPALLEAAVFGDGGATHAVLLPLTRGLSPDVDLGSMVCSATNAWLAETWLGEWNAHGRYRGSIRVNAHDPRRAVAEIQRWQEHPHMIQVAVATEAHAPYGKREYVPIWEAAAAAGLPVVVHSDAAAGVELFPTPVGYFRHFIEFSAYASMNFFYHLSNLIAEGVFERVPRLRFVFADGGLDVLGPLMWRLDEHWRALRYEHPWVAHAPTEYLRAHVRFWTHRFEGPTDESAVESVMEVTEAADLQIYASRYPFWTHCAPADAVRGASAAAAERILGGGAHELYRGTFEEAA